MYLSDFLGSRRVSALMQPATSGILMPASIIGARSASVAVSAGYQTVLSITGRGALALAACRAQGGSAAMAIRITLDGRVVLTTPAISVANSEGFCALGSIIRSYETSASIGGFAPDPVEFSQSLLVEMQVATSTAVFYYNYRTYL